MLRLGCAVTARPKSQALLAAVRDGAVTVPAPMTVARLQCLTADGWALIAD
jgi:hypothetical protein